MKIMFGSVFVDSCDYIFVSCIGSNRLYCSTDFGTAFTEVLNTNHTENDAFYIVLTGDSTGALYTVTYQNSDPVIFPLSSKALMVVQLGLLLQLFSTVHYHNIKFNPDNGYLYVCNWRVCLGLPQWAL
jgi:hypothetical protein